MLAETLNLKTTKIHWQIPDSIIRSGTSLLNECCGSCDDDHQTEVRGL
jgi:hypothetical protein